MQRMPRDWGWGWTRMTEDELMTLIANYAAACVASKPQLERELGGRIREALRAYAVDAFEVARLARVNGWAPDERVAANLDANLDDFTGL